VVQEPDELIATITGIDVTCFDGDDGEAISNVTGGNGNYAFNWNNNSQDSINTGLTAGSYFLTVTDFRGCNDTTSIVINQPPEIDITGIDVVDAFCYADSNGSVTPIVTGGTPPFEYSLDGINYQASSTIGNLMAGIYTVYVRDAFGCEYTQNATVSQPQRFYVEAGDDQTIELGYEAQIQAFANTFPDQVSYTWTPPMALSCTDCDDPVANPVQTTTYTVLATDARGCPATDSLTIFVEILRPFFVPNVFTPNYDGNNDAFYVYGGPAIHQVRTLRVFDRWGGHVFRADNIPANTPELGWDGLYRGQRVQPAVFVYYIEIEFVDGHIEIVKGDVTVMR
jgi:gliding motility-associated-like protein